MKRLSTAVLLILCFATVSIAQPKRGKIPFEYPSQPGPQPADLKLGAVVGGILDSLKGGRMAKVVEVVDANQVIVAIVPPTFQDPKYVAWVVLKCPTKGMVDGKEWSHDPKAWKENTGSETWKVADTGTYATKAGKRTMFVLEKPSAEDLEKLRKADAEQQTGVDEQQRKKTEAAKAKADEDAARMARMAEREERLRKAQEEGRKNAERQKVEDRAATFLRYAKKLVDDPDMAKKAKERLQEVIRDFPGTDAAKEAKQLLEKLSK